MIVKLFDMSLVTKPYDLRLCPPIFTLPNSHWQTEHETKRYPTSPHITSPEGMCGPDYQSKMLLPDGPVVTRGEYATRPPSWT